MNLPPEVLAAVFLVACGIWGGGAVVHGVEKGGRATVHATKKAGRAVGHVVRRMTH